MVKFHNTYLLILLYYDIFNDKIIINYLIIILFNIFILYHYNVSNKFLF